MVLVESPFLGWQTVAAAATLGVPPSPHRLRTLRRHRALSPGSPVMLRSSGRFLGSVRLYSTLAADAARLYRRGHKEAAARIAARAEELEGSEPGQVILKAIAESAEEFLSASLPEQRDCVREYVEMRRRLSSEALDRTTLVKAWLTEPQAWLPGAEVASLTEALLSMSQHVEAARSEEHQLQALGVMAFIGLVERLAPTMAELRADDGFRTTVPRRDLEREGLATIGQAVKIVKEEVPGGPILTTYSAAGRLDREAPSAGPSSFDDRTPIRLSQADAAWIDRLMEASPAPPPLAPLLIGDA